MNVKRAKQLAQERPGGFSTLQDYWRVMRQIRQALDCPVPSDAQYDQDGDANLLRAAASRFRSDGERYEADVEIALADWLDTVADSCEPPDHSKRATVGRTISQVDLDGALTIARTLLGRSA